MTTRFAVSTPFDSTTIALEGEEVVTNTSSILHIRQSHQSNFSNLTPHLTDQSQFMNDNITSRNYCSDDNSLSEPETAVSNLNIIPYEDQEDEDKV